MQVNGVFSNLSKKFSNVHIIDYIDYFFDYIDKKILYGYFSRYLSIFLMKKMLMNHTYNTYIYSYCYIGIYVNDIVYYRILY